MGVGSVELHARSIVIDAVCPLLTEKKYVDWYREGGVTVAAPTVSGQEGIPATMRAIGAWKAFIRSRQDLIQIHHGADIGSAKRDTKLGLLFHFQGADPIEDSLDMIHVYKELGVGIIQL